MAIIKYDSKLSDIVLKEPSTISILNKFDINLGFGDKSIADICSEKSMDIDFITTILNTFINDEYFPEETLKSFRVEKIIEYFNQTNNYYQRFQIPNIERHFDLLISKSECENNNLALLRNFFKEVKSELLGRIDYDTNTLFPLILNDEYLHDSVISENNDLIQDKLDDLVNMFVIHLKGKYDVNLCHAVLLAILSLQKDIKQNNRIRYRIFYPLINN